MASFLGNMVVTALSLHHVFGCTQAVGISLCSDPQEGIGVDGRLQKSKSRLAASDSTILRTLELEIYR